MGEFAKFGAAAVAALGAFLLAFYGLDGWGWFLFASVVIASC